jgi:hypothetical protein
LGKNVSHAAELATTVDAQGGIIAYSLALSPSVSRTKPHKRSTGTCSNPLRGMSCAAMASPCRTSSKTGVVDGSSNTEEPRYHTPL